MLLRADKENIGEISKDDWFETLTAAGLHVEMYFFFLIFVFQTKTSTISSSILSATRRGGSIIEIFWLIVLWSKKICRPEMLVWSVAKFILRWSFFHRADVEALFEAQDRDLDGKLSWEGLWSLGHIWLGWLWQKRWGQWCDGDDDDDDDDGYEGNDGDGDGDNNDDNEDDGDNRDDDDDDDDDDSGYGDGAFATSEFCGEQTATERAFLLLDPDRDGKISKQVLIC